jgi:CMP-N,N'-diacetyllegionaminic acid synthase
VGNDHPEIVPSPGINPIGLIAIITARGGSKRLPGKNILPLAGKPLIAWTIEAARDCSLVERCIVSTEDPEIGVLARSWGAEVMDRPAHLAGDEARSEDVVLQVLDALARSGDEPEEFALLQPTSPLRTVAHLEECIRQFHQSGCASAISVTEAEHHPYKAFKSENGELKPLFGEGFLSRRHQDLPLVYRQNGAIYLNNAQGFREAGSFYIAPVFPYIMTSDVSIDIDSRADLRIAEYVLTRKG